ncbi:metal-sulfur cluster assembly factor [Silvimonas sp. JCM 19000]
MPNTTENTIRNALRTVLDPEIGINVVDLGLIYAVDVAAPTVTIRMTMTTPSCPMGKLLQDEVYAAAQAALGAGWQLDVQLVWQPAWTPQCMSAAARTHFGWEPGL